MNAHSTGLSALVSAAIAVLPPCSHAGLSLREALVPMSSNGAVVALFEFEGSLASRVAHPALAVSGRLVRASSACDGAGALLSPGAPRFVPGRSGLGLLLEEGTTNLFESGSSNGGEALSCARSLRGARVDPAGGESGMVVRTVGRTAYEGVGAWFGPVGTGVAAVTASVDVRGRGRLCLRLWDRGNDMAGAPVYTDLAPGWRRVVLPPVHLNGLGSSRLEVCATTAEPLITEFAVTRLQAEPTAASTSWIPGGGSRSDECLALALAPGGWPWPEGTAVMRVQLHWSSWSIDAGRSFLWAGRGEPGLFWNAYNSLGTIGQQGYPRVPAPDPGAAAWRFMAVSWSKDRVTVCFDGACVTGERGGSWQSAKELVVGQRANAAIDDLALLSRALSADELKALSRVTQ